MNQLFMRRRAVLAFAALSGLAVAQSGAQTLTFSPTGQLPLGPGGGIWDTTSLRWYNGSAFVPYGAGTTSTNNAVLPGGIIELGLTDTIGAGGIQITGNTTLFPPQPGPGANLFLNGNAVIDTGAFTLNVQPNLRGTGGATQTITKTGTGILAAHRALGTNATVASAAGTFAIAQGTVGFLNSGADFSDNTWVNISNGAALDMALAGGPVNDGFGMFSGAGLLKLGTFTNLGVNWGSSLTSGTLNTGVATWSGSITGGGRYQKVGTGTQVFTGSNTYTGPTSIQAGVLRVEGGSGLADTTDVFMSNVATAVLQLGASETIGSIGGGGTTGGNVDIGANTLTVGDSNRYNGFGGNFIGSGLVVKRGTGLLSIQNTTPVSAFTGKYRIENGILSFRDDARIAAIGAAAADAITLAGGTMSNSNAGGGTWTSGRGITVTSPSAILILGSSISNQFADGSFSGSASITKAGDGILSLGADNAGFSGDWIVRDGQLATARGLGTPFGTGGIDVSGSTVSIAPGAGGITVNHTLASGTGESFAYGPGSVLNLNKNAGNTELNVTAGGFVRNARGTLVIQAQTGVASLGTAGSERLFVTGGVGTTNGIVPGVIGTTGGGSTAGHFLDYNVTDGFKVATYTSSDITTSGTSAVVDQTAGATLATPATAYALRLGDGVSGAALDLGGQQLSLGSALILNLSSTITNGTVDFGSNQAVIYSQAAAGAIGATLTGTNGLSKVGVGPLTLDTAATYTGPTHISQGTLVVNTSNALPTSTALTIENNGILNIGGNSQTVATLSGNRTANIIMGSGGQLTVGSGNSTYLGRINAGGSAVGTLVKDGTGTLTLGVTNSQTGNDSETLLYSKLAVRNGGVVSVSTVSSLPPAATGTPVSDAITLDGGTLRITSVNSAAFGSGGFSSFSLSASNTTLRGLTVGVGGGTIEVAEAKEIVFFQRGNGAVIGTDDAPLISGSGILTKTGPGFLRLGIGNDASFTGKWVVKGGNIQFQDGRSLGSASTYTPDFLTLDGGMIQANGFGTFSPNQGITIGAGGGTLNASFTFSQEFRGSGPLTKITTNTVTYQAASPLWSSPIDILAGIISVNATDALGTGTITITPTLQAGLSKIGASVGDATIGNPVVLNTGSTIDVRVDVNTFTLNGDISGPGGFIKTGGGTNGQGTLVLNGNNSFAGEINIDGGTVVARSNTALGTGAGIVQVNPGTTLGFDNNINSVSGKTVVISGTGLSAGGAIRNIGGDNTYNAPVIVHQDASIEVSSGNLTLGALSGNSALTVNGTGTLAAGGIRVNTLNVNNPRVAITAGRSAAKTSQISTLNLGANTLDLNDNDLVVSNTTAAAVRAQIISGQITSTVAAGQPERALGSAQASDVLGAIYPAPFSGVQVQSGTDVVVRYTYRGDATLNGQVDSIDFGNFLAGYGLTTGGTWVTGDFNYDDKVNTIDFNYLAGNFGATPIASPTPAAALGSVVPEPGSLSLVAIALAGLAGRRRRN